jgi:hypothetical protein
MIAAVALARLTVGFGLMAGVGGEREALSSTEVLIRPWSSRRM